MAFVPSDVGTLLSGSGNVLATSPAMAVWSAPTGDEDVLLSGEVSRGVNLVLEEFVESELLVLKVVLDDGCFIESAGSELIEKGTAGCSWV